VSNITYEIMFSLKSNRISVIPIGRRSTDDRNDDHENEDVEHEQDYIHDTYITHTHTHKQTHAIQQEDNKQ